MWVIESPGPAPDTRELIVRRNYLITYRAWRTEVSAVAEPS
jgi:hypothetical protein